MISRAAAQWGQALLDAAGLGGTRLPAGWPGDDPEARLAVGRDWAESGVLALTGRAGGDPVMPTGAGATAARGAGLALAEVTGRLGVPVVVDGGRLLGERAALRRLARRGDVSASGGSRLLRAADGWVALTLARAADTERIPALVSGVAAEPWEAAQRWLAGQAAAAARERAGLLGLALGVVPRPPAGGGVAALASEPGNRGGPGWPRSVAGGRPELAVGGTAVRAPAAPGRAGGGQGGEHRPAGRSAGRGPAAL